MLTDERQQRILSTLEENDIITIAELIEPLEASESTIRRDLQHLENQGLLIRVHGGAKKKQQLNFEANMMEKEAKFHEEKLAIGRYAANLIKPKDVIYLDAGTSTMAMIPFIEPDLGIKVVTNSVMHAALLVEKNIETVILGGTIKLSTNAITGFSTATQLQQFRFNKAFMGMNGAHLENGFTTPDPEEAIIKKLAIAQSQMSFVLLDGSKFQQTAFTHVADLTQAEIITSKAPKEIMKKMQLQTRITEVSS